MAPDTAKRPSARERLLAAADELFYEEGVHSVGIDRIIERAGVAKASLYNTFGSKDQLIRAYLEARHARWSERVEGELAAHYDNPRDRLLGVFDVLGELFAAPDFNGCAFMNASAEAKPGGVIEVAVEDFRTWVRQLFRTEAVAAGARDPDALAAQLVLLYDGASAAAQLDHDPGVAVTAKLMATALVDAALAPAQPA
jgi:AcrR family transcriptional regulator